MGLLFTVGYSGLEIDRFLKLLQDRRVDVLCDVRSVPYSRFRPDFSRRDLKKHLNNAGMKYAFFGNELGARPKERSVYVRGQAVHNLIAKKDFFQAGLERLRRGIVNHNLVLLCSEREPLECHRAVLICRYLRDERNHIAHIHTDGRMEPHEQFENRLIASHNSNSAPLFEGMKTWETVLYEAYDKQSKMIAFTETTTAEALSSAPAP